MDIRKILAEYDAMFGAKSLSQIEAYLYQKICEAAKLQDDGALLTLLNEMIGLCRDTSQKEKAVAYCGQLKKLLDGFSMQGTESYATSMQNIANAYRAFGMHKEALEAFEQIEKTYEICLPREDYLWAALYNNWGLLYQETGDFEKSVAVLERALDNVSRRTDAIKVAITKTNLTNSLLALGEKERAEKEIKAALEIFRRDNEVDFHYGAALVAMGDCLAAGGAWMKAAAYYRSGIVEILLHTGKSDGYYRVNEKYEASMQKSKEADGKQKPVSHLEICRKFYETYGKPMISQHFPEYESRIAVGMAGEGSDCFGFEDEISKDHDFGIGFCMWITKEDYRLFGEDLQREYETLLAEQDARPGQNRFLDGRRGVLITEEFFGNIREEWQIAEKINGAVFRDDAGIVSQKRSSLSGYYPAKVKSQKLACLLHEFSQYGQVNYGRMMARGDEATAAMCIGKTIECAFDIAYLLEEKYAPYYKWKRKGLEQVGEGKWRDVLWVCEALAMAPCRRSVWEDYEYRADTLNAADKRVRLVELLAGLLLEEIKKTYPLEGDDVFLERYVNCLEEAECNESKTN